MRTKRKEKSFLSRLVCCLTSVIMLAALVPETLIAAAQNADDAFKISLSWNKAEDKYNYSYNSDSEENRIVRLKISYENKEVTGGYAPGELRIILTGLKSAVRPDAYGKKAYIAVPAADKEGTPESERRHEWSYSYTDANDQWVFTNNNSIESKASFEGSFELYWELPSRDTFDNFETDLQAELQVGDTSVTSNSVHYSQTRKRDEYTVSMDASAVYRDELPSGSQPAGEDSYLNYIWVNYTVSGSDIYYARDVKGAERFDVYFLEDAEVRVNPGLTDSGETVEIEGKKYKRYFLNKDITSSGSAEYISNIFVAYPREKYENEQVDSFVYIRGTYYDEESESDLAYDICSSAMNDFDFKDPPGDVYKVLKDSYGIHSTSIDSHDELCQTHGAINSAHLSNGGGTYYSDLRLSLNILKKGSYSIDKDGKRVPRYDADSYDLEFTDDYLDILLNNGEIRRLSDDEFSFTAVEIPSNKDIYNQNGLPIKADTYKYNIYYRKRGEAEGTFGNLLEKSKDATITTTARKFDLPDDAVGVRICFYDISENISTTYYNSDGTAWAVQLTMARLYYKFNIADVSEIVTNDGRLFNNMFFKLYRNRNEYTDDDGVYYPAAVHEWCNYRPKSDYISSDGSDREFNRDVSVYGATEEKAFDRENAVTHILEIPSEYRIRSTEITYDESASDSYNFRFSGGITAGFELGEDVELSDFTLFTVIPEGLRLVETCNDPDTLLDALSFSSSNGLSDAFLSSHAEIEIVDDPDQYDGRQYLKIHFNFDDDPQVLTWVKVAGIPMYASKSKVPTGKASFTFRSAMTVDQAGKWYTNSVDNNKSENNVWLDIDGDGSTEDLASFGIDHVQIDNPESSQVQLVKFVETGFTDMGPENPSPDVDLVQVPKTYEADDYYYYLRAYVDDNVTMTNIIFVDVIERSTDKSEWFGSFKDVDISGVSKYLTYDKGETPQSPTIYYSIEKESFEQEGDAGSQHNVINRDIFTKAGSGWKILDANTPAEVRANIQSIAVDFGNARFNKAEAASEGNADYLELKIIMSAPDDSDKSVSEQNYNKRTVNAGSIGYDKVNADTDQITEHKNLDSNAVPVRYVPKGKIVLTKKDAENGDVIKGAQFELYKVGTGENGEDEKVGDTYTVNSKGRLTVSDLTYGTYYFKEISAPKGYEISAETSGNIKLTENDPTAKIEFNNTRKGGTFTLKKVSERQPDTTLAGAEFALYHDGNFYGTYTTDKDGILEAGELPWGSYTLRETKPPKGYELSDETIEFEIGADNDAGRELETFIFKNEQLPAKATLTKTELADNKYDTPDGEANYDTEAPIKGAVYKLYDADGGEIATKVTDKEGKIYAEDLTFGKYYFQETVPATGYELNSEKLWFEVDENNTEANIEAKDYSEQISTFDVRKKGSVWLQKLDEKKLAVKGAEYGLYRIAEDGSAERMYVHLESGSKYVFDPEQTAGSVLEMVTSSEGVIEISGLYWGEYYLKEEKSPMGYELNDDLYKFTISKENASRTVTVEAVDPRLKGSVTLTKVSEENNNVKLAGAEFVLYKSDGTLYMDKDADGNALRTDEDGTLTVKGLEWGSYYFEETKAPAGYGLTNKKIRFSVNYLTADPDKPQLITVEDPAKSYPLKVTKRIATKDILFEHGNPTFTFKVDKIADDGTVERTYTKTVAFSENNVDFNSEYAEVSVTFSVPIGKYDIYETKAIRYELESIEPAEYKHPTEDGKARINIDGTFETEDIEFVFQNKKTDQSKTSHTSMVTNIVNRDSQLTAIRAVYDGAEITGETVDTSHLQVIAVYDDGTEITLAPKSDTQDGYVTDPEKFDSSMNGNYTVTVSFTDGGKTCTDTFDAEVNVPELFTWEYDESEGPFEENGVKYDGTATITGYLGESSIVAFPGVVKGWRSFDRNDSNGDGLYYIDHPEFSDKKYKVVKIEGDSDGGYGALYGMKGRTGVKFAEGIQEIGFQAFSGVKTLTGDIVLPKSLVTIGSSAFSGCSGLTGGLIIPDGSALKVINPRAFYNCTGLSGNISFPKTLDTLGNSAFWGCKNLTGVEFDKDCPLTKINYEAFKGCTGLSGELVLPNNLKTISYGAFYGCEKLSGTLTIPASVTTIGTTSSNYGAFQDCKGLTGLSFAQGSNLEVIGNFSFCGCANLSGDLVFPSSLKTIGNSAFYNCSKLNGELIINDGLETIGEYAFANCYDLSLPSGGVFKIPDSVVQIGKYAFDQAFKNNGNFAELKLPENSKFTRIEEGTFRYCIRLYGDLVIPNNVTYIGGGAFVGFATGGDKSKRGTLTIPPTVTEIADSVDYKGAFMESNLTRVKFEDPWNSQLTKIGNHAFYQCYKIGENGGCQIVIPGSVTSIGNWAFGLGNNVTNLILLSGGSIGKQIGTSAFNRLGNQFDILEDVYIPSEYTNISEGDDGAFYKIADSLSTKPTLNLPSAANGIKHGYSGTVLYGDYTVAFNADHTKIIVTDSSGATVHTYTYDTG